MARFLRSDPEEIAAEIMNDVDSDDGDMYGEEEEKEDNFSYNPLASFPQDCMSPVSRELDDDIDLVEDPDDNNIDLA